MTNYWPVQAGSIPVPFLYFALDSKLAKIVIGKSSLLRKATQN